MFLVMMMLLLLFYLHNISFELLFSPEKYKKKTDSESNFAYDPFFVFLNMICRRFCVFFFFGEIEGVVVG